MSERDELFGMKIVENETVPAGEVRFVDPLTDECVGKIVDIEPARQVGIEGEG